MYRSHHAGVSADRKALADKLKVRRPVVDDFHRLLVHEFVRHTSQTRLVRAPCLQMAVAALTDKYLVLRLCRNGVVPVNAAELAQSLSGRMFFHCQIVAR